VKKSVVVTLVALSAAAAFAASWSGSFRFSPSSVSLTAVARDGASYQLVQPVKGRCQPGLAALVVPEPGHPMLPQWQFTLVIPQGMRVAGIECEARGANELGRGYRLSPGQPRVPFSKTATPPFVSPDPAVYESDAAFPGSSAEASPVGIKSGFRLVTITLHPVQYQPVSGLLSIAGELAVTVRYEPDPTARREFLTAGQLASFGPAVRALAYNPEDVNRYAPAEHQTDFGNIDCVIITSAALESNFLPLVNWRTKKGFKTETRLVSWITSTYSGRDTPEKIRNFIIDYYNNQGLRFVVLGGDNAIVPCRQARVLCPGYTGDIPCDLYYGDIQGSWDNDNDNIFGEEGDDTVDLYYDLYVGRASVDNTTQVQTFVDKILTHEKNPPTAYLKRMLLADAQLWTGYNYQQSSESIAAITPSGWTDVMIHDPGGSTIVRDSINNGFQFAHLVGHGNENGVYDGSCYYSVAYANSQTNGDRVNLMNSIACYSGNFEYEDCCAEAAHNRDGGGSIAMIFNSRYGWGPGPGINPPGPSELFDIRFYDYFFNHDTMPIGITLALSKEVYRADALYDPYMRWCYYELNLFGDPLLLMYKDVPGQLATAFSNPIGTGNQSFTVTVTASGSPVGNSLVCLLKGAEVYTRGYTNGSGQATFAINPSTAGYMYVTATRANYLPDEDSAQVTLGTARDVGVERIVAPAGTIDSGATVTPQAWVRNYGSMAATFPVTMRIGSGYSNNQNVSSLAPGDSALVSFTNWIASPRGAQTVRCSTGLTSDQYTDNDTLSGSVTVRVTNVGVTAIVAPTGTIDSGTMTTPRARVKNFGSAAASFPVTFSIGSFYTNTQNVTSLNPGDSVTLNFANWTATQPGTFGTRCTAALAGDQVPGNNLQTGTVTVRVLNVGALRIVAPTGTIDSGVAVTPQARVRNYGSAAASFPVTFRVGSFYTNTQNVTSLAPGDSVLVGFTAWTPTQRGTSATRCSTALGGDQIHANDTLSGSVTVRVLNVGALRILAPTGTYDSGAAVQPQARVRNYGTAAASFPVTFRVGSFYSNTQNVTSLAPGDSVLVAFAFWNVLQRGTHATRCTTALAGDVLPANDALSGTVTVRVPGDAGVSQMLGPTGVLDSGATATPQAVVRNYGGAAASFPVTFRIGTVYANTQNVANLAPGDSAIVSFADWTAVRRGAFATGCTTALVGDTVTANNGQSGTVTVRVQDIGVVGINSPSGTYEPGRIVTPAAIVRNYGSVPADFDAWMLITDPTGAPFYAAGTNVTNVAPGANALVNTFPACTLDMVGDWTVKCSTAMPGDVNPANNVLAGGFRTQSVWVEVKSMPVTPSGQAVKDGAWLAYHGANGLIYSAKGNKTCDFYSYNPATGGWIQLRQIPYGTEAKPPRKGGCGASDGNRYVYAAKGNNTLGFWRYDVVSDSWRQLANVPTGSGNIKGGAGAVYVDAGGAGYVYLLKGGGAEFCRYNTVTGAWQNLLPAPFGAKPKWDKGSFVVYDGDHTIYAHKAKYNELWAYNTQTDSWGRTELSGMPFVGRTGRNKKSKDGGAGAWASGNIYALKGGNTTEFWRYDANANGWLELDTMPSYGSSGRMRRVNAGGSMVSAAGTLFALKGNKTCEFWRYAPGFVLTPQPAREGVMANPMTIDDCRLTISPNPLTGGFATIHLSSRLATPFSLRIYNAAGRCILSQSAICNRQSAMPIDLRSIPAGVYLVKVEAGGFAVSQKLVVQK
jgi:hypothetical protein